MKKIIVSVVVLACVSAISIAAVNSANIVGYAKVDAIKGQLTMVALNFEPSTNLVTEIIGDQLPTGTILHVWDKSAAAYKVPIIKALRGGWPAAATINLGDAFWIQLPVTAPETNTVTLSGEVLIANTNSVVIGAGIEGTGYFFPVDTLFTNTDLAAQLPVGSIIHVWNPPVGAYDVPYIKALRGGWSTAGSLTIGPTTGFWIQLPGASLPWNEERPFGL